MKTIISPATKLLVPLGQTVSTPGAMHVLTAAGVSARDLFLRHCTGDWGDLCADDKLENELAVQQGFRILSAYM